MRLLLASANQGKLRELRQLCAHLPLEILTAREAGFTDDVEETGTTFEENAMLKAQAVVAATGEAALADDSGLMVDALDGAPGVYSARFTGNHDDSDEVRYRFLLQKLEGVTDRRAKFVCCACCLVPDGRLFITRGECHGEIMTEPAGHMGFGYDPVFRPDGYTQTMAELGPAVKNEIGHRGKAMRQVCDYLANLYK